jgi:hypothetical protein
MNTGFLGKTGQMKFLEWQKEGFCPWRAVVQPWPGGGAPVGRWGMRGSGNNVLTIRELQRQISNLYNALPANSD